MELTDAEIKEDYAVYEGLGGASYILYRQDGGFHSEACNYRKSYSFDFQKSFNLDVPVLKESVQYLWERHTWLKAEKESGSTFLTYDASTVKEEKLDLAITKRLDRKLCKINGPLLIADVYYLPAMRRKLVLTIGQQIFSYWRLLILRDELCLVYDCLLNNKRIELPEPDCDFKTRVHFRERIHEN